MAIEIERKFLVKNDQWKSSISRSSHFRQGYLSKENNCSVRLRTTAEKAWLNIKSITIGAERQEFEYEVPLADADQMLATLCRKPLIEKTRHFIEVGDHLWELDLFEGDNEGLIVAEIELDSVNEPFEMPSWAGDEVTDDPRYYNNQLVLKPYCEWSD